MPSPLVAAPTLEPVSPTPARSFAPHRLLNVRSTSSIRSNDPSHNHPTHNSETASLLSARHSNPHVTPRATRRRWLKIPRRRSGAYDDIGDLTNGGLRVWYGDYTTIALSMSVDLDWVHDHVKERMRMRGLRRNKGFHGRLLKRIDAAQAWIVLTMIAKLYASKDGGLPVVRSNGILVGFIAQTELEHALMQVCKRHVDANAGTGGSGGGGIPRLIIHNLGMQAATYHQPHHDMAAVNGERAERDLFQTVGSENNTNDETESSNVRVFVTPASDATRDSAELASRTDESIIGNQLPTDQEHDSDDRFDHGDGDLDDDLEMGNSAHYDKYHDSGGEFFDDPMFEDDVPESDPIEPVDISQWVDQTPLTVPQSASIELVLELFVKLGVRTLCVVNEGKYVGIVHKKRLLAFINTKTRRTSAFN
eukprot:jgi/Hompol1/2125/HPOL_001596-RA